MFLSPTIGSGCFSFQIRKSLQTRNYINKHSRLSRALDISTLISKRNDHRNDFAKSNCTTKFSLSLQRRLLLNCLHRISNLTLCRQLLLP